METTERKQNDVIVNFKKMTGKRPAFLSKDAPRKVTFVTVEVNEHDSEHGTMFSIDLNYREQFELEKETATTEL